MRDANSVSFGRYWCWMRFRFSASSARFAKICFTRVKRSCSVTERLWKSSSSLSMRFSSRTTEVPSGFVTVVLTDWCAGLFPRDLFVGRLAAARDLLGRDGGRTRDHHVRRNGRVMVVISLADVCSTIAGNGCMSSRSVSGDGGVPRVMRSSLLWWWSRDEERDGIGIGWDRAGLDIIVRKLCKRLFTRQRRNVSTNLFFTSDKRKTLLSTSTSRRPSQKRQSLSR